MLSAYKHDHGDCNVPRFWKDNPTLGTWCHTQRGAYKDNRLSADRIKRLEQLGFKWDLLVVTWEEMYAELSTYKQTHSDSNVPAGWKDNPKLGMWCGKQRQAYRKNDLSPDQIKRLDQIGFVWDLIVDYWGEMYAALSAYKQIHGDCHVPAGWKDNPKLGSWCANQRTRYKNRKLSADRVKRLEQLGFVWDPLAVAWECYVPL